MRIAAGSLIIVLALGALVLWHPFAEPRPDPGQKAKRAALAPFVINLMPKKKQTAPKKTLVPLHLLELMPFRDRRGR